jgi:hypothetical protein
MNAGVFAGRGDDVPLDGQHALSTSGEVAAQEPADRRGSSEIFLFEPFAVVKPKLPSRAERSPSLERVVALNSGGVGGCGVTAD